MRILLIALFTFLQVAAYSQESLSSFLTGPEDLLELDIEYVVDGKDKYNIYLSFDEDGTSVKLTPEQAEAFANNIAIDFLKWKDWVKTADDNDVDELTKDINEYKIGELLAFRYGGWEFAFGKSRVQTGIYRKDGTNIFYVRLPSRTSSSNQYIESDTVVILFYTEEQVNVLLGLLTESEIIRVVDEHNAKENLFQ